jgi:plasmid maintenance system antidote protein VapI
MERTQRWRLERRVSVSVLVQLLTLAGLIVESWVNLQRQLDLVSHDVKQLLTAQGKFCDKLKHLQERTIALEYRLRTVEQGTTNRHE